MANALDVIQVVAEFALLGQKVLNVFEWALGDDALDAHVIDDIANWIEGMYSEVQLLQADDLSYESLSFKNVTQDVDLGSMPWPTITNGESLGQILPLGVAGLVTAPTFQPKVRGRKFLAGFTESDAQDGYWNSSVEDALINFGASWVTPFMGTLSNVWIIPGVINSADVFKLFASAIASNIPAYQRRRKQGVGA